MMWQACGKSLMIWPEVFLASLSANLLANPCYCGCSKQPSPKKMKFLLVGHDVIFTNISIYF